MIVFGWGPYGKIDVVKDNNGRELYAIATHCQHLMYCIFLPQHLLLLTGEDENGQQQGIEIPKSEPTLAALYQDQRSMAAAYFRAFTIWWPILVWGFVEENRTEALPVWFKAVLFLFWAYLVRETMLSYQGSPKRTLAIAKLMGAYNGEIGDVTINIRRHTWKYVFSLLVGILLFVLAPVI